MGNPALMSDSKDDAALSALSEAVEQAAWRDALRAAPPTMLAAWNIHALEIGGALVLASCGSRNLLFNRVIGLGERQPASDETIAKIVECYRGLGAPQYLVHAGAYAQPIRLSIRLQQHGLQPYRRSWVKLIRPAHLVRSVHTEVSVRPAHPADAPVIASIVGAGFDLTQGEAEIIAHLIGRSRWRMFIAEVGGRPVGAAGLFLEGRFGYLPFAATRPEFRGRGAQRALLQARCDAAVAAGSDYVTTETGFPMTADEPSPSYHNLLWAGFRPLSIRDNYAPVGTQWDHGVAA